MKLFEVAALANSQLSALQKETLLRLFMARDSGSAMQGIAGNAHYIAAAEYLMKAGFIVSNGDVQVTPEGEGELVAAGLIDNNGPTDQARTLLGQPPARTAPAQSSDKKASADTSGNSEVGATT